MSDMRLLSSCGLATARKPRVVLVGSVGSLRIADQFRKLDWEVLNVPTSCRLACAVLARKPSAVMLPIETGCESGFLVAAKLRAARRKLKVVLVGSTRTAEAERFAKFVGATLATDTDGIANLVGAIAG